MLAVIGDIVQDIVIWLQEPVRYGTDTRAEIFVTRGGSAANVAAFAGPRVPTRFIGSVGDDLAGWVVRRDLRDKNVDVKLQESDLPTGMIVVQIDDTGERNMFPSRGASGDLQPVDPTWLEGVELLHLTLYSFESEQTAQSAIAAATDVRAAGGKVCLDLSSVYTMDGLGKDRVWKVLQALQPSFVSANEDETRFLGLAEGDVPGPNLPELAGTQLLARNGANATHVFRDGQLVTSVPVEPATDVRDLTGAGDAFNAGFLTSVLRDGDDPHTNVLNGHRMARRVLSCPGASEPPLEEGEAA